MPNLAGLILPTPNVSTGWGSTLNSDLTIIDNVFADNGSGTSVGLQVGTGKTLNAGGTVIAGGTMILGSGDGTNTVAAPTIRGAARTGTNAAGPNLTIDALNGTGTGGSGSIIFRTAPAGVAGTTANTMASRLEINSAGAIGIAGANYGSANQVLLSGGTAATPSWSNVDGSVITIPSQAQGDLLYRGASAWVRLAAGTSGQLLRTNGAAANPSWQSVPTQQASQTITASGNSFTAIPSTAKIIYIAVSGLNAGTSSLANIRIGTSSGFLATGYNSSASFFQKDSGTGGDGGTVQSTTGFALDVVSSSVTLYGTITLINVGGNLWTCSHTMGAMVSGDSTTVFGGGSKDAGGTLDRVQVVPVSGAFTASGSISISYI
jgi:hypothetical protein